VGGGPQHVDFSVHYRAVCAGDRHTCAVVAGGDSSAVCLGRNDRYQLGDGTTEDSLEGTSVVVAQEDTSAPPIYLNNVRQVACRKNMSCAVTNDNVLYCWGSMPIGFTEIVGVGAKKIADSVSQVAVGDGRHLCFVTTAGKVSCLGKNESNALGVSGVGETTTPQDVPGFPDTTSDPPNSHAAVEVTVGASHSCARLDSGIVKCWGGNWDGQLGSSAPSASGPTAIPGLRAKSIAAGYDHTCAVGEDGVVRCWGDNAGGALGNGKACEHQTAPVAVVGATLRAKLVAASMNHTCMVSDGDNVYCWGMNGTGQLGIGPPYDGATMVPTRVPYTWTDPSLVKNVRAITTGRWHTCAGRNDGKLQCWGRGDTGQLNDGGRNDSPLPVPTLP
jgi:alpha-tubulin suppressor-like RCC1 family protein